MRTIFGMAMLAAALIIPTAADAACGKGVRHCTPVQRVLPRLCGCARDDSDCISCCLCIRRGGRPSRCCF